MLCKTPALMATAAQALPPLLSVQCPGQAVSCSHSCQTLGFSGHRMATRRICPGKEEQGQQGLEQDSCTWDLLGEQKPRGQLSAKCLQQPRSHQGQNLLLPFRLPSALLAQCPSCGPALGSLLQGDFPASSHTRASFPLQPAAKASLLLTGRQPAGTSPASGRGSEEVCECSPVPALLLAISL